MVLSQDCYKNAKGNISMEKACDACSNYTWKSKIWFSYSTVNFKSFFWELQNDVISYFEQKYREMVSSLKKPGGNQCVSL